MINIAIVGCGYWGHNLIRVFSQAGLRSQLHSCCDLDESKFKKIKLLYPSINVSTNYDEILNNPEIHAIVISTKTSSHYNLAKLALLSNKHVLIEKPMTSNSQEAKELIDLAKQQDKLIMVDHTFEYEPAIRKIKKIVQSNELGEIYCINANWLNLGLLQMDTNVVFDLAPHVFSILNYITGKEPLSLRATGEAYVNKNTNLEEMANIVIKYPNKLIAAMNISWLDPCKTRKMVIVGSKKMLVFDLLQKSEQIKIFDKGIDLNYVENKIDYRFGDIYSPTIPSNEPLKEMANHFIDCIKENKKSLTSGENGLAVVKLLEASNKSLKNNGIEIKLNDSNPSGIKFKENVKIFQPTLTNIYGCEIGDNTKIGAFVEIQKNARIGKNCKISSHSFICEGVVIKDNVFIGHGVRFINDKYPRATSNGVLQTEEDWKVINTLVKKGASIGTNATILCGITIGENSIVGAGSVVTKDVPPNSIVYGNPAKLKNTTNSN